MAHDRPWSERVSLSASGRRVATFKAGGTAHRILGRLGLAKAATLQQLLAFQLRAAARAISGGPADPALATAAEGLSVMCVLDAVRDASGQPGEWVAVEDAEVGAPCSP